jgi:cysteine desulfurase
MIYLDNSATTRPYPEVTLEMVKCLEEDFGNPSSLHRLGIIAEKRIKAARRSLALQLGAKEGEIFFNSGGTEADNTAILGAAQALKRRGNRIITTKIEHPAILESCKKLSAMGFEVIYAGVDDQGRVDLSEIESSINNQTILISVMHVNNETGTIQPIEEIGKISKRFENLCFHSDAIQSFGKISLDPLKCGVDLLSISSHKIHGPKGVGALYIRSGVRVEPLIVGGGQEMGWRSGTENVPGVAGFGKAAELICSGQTGKMKEMAKVRSHLLNGIRTEIPDIRLNSMEGTGCSPAILNISFPGTRGEVLLHMLEQSDIYVSTGSACSSKKQEGSYVLKASGLSDRQIEGTIRFSLSEFNTIAEMDITIDRLKTAVISMRKTLKGM